MTAERDNFDKLTDEQLLFLIRHFNQDPFEVLLERYHPVIRKLIREYYVHGFDDEDLWQEARIVFHRIVHFYEEGRGYTLGKLFQFSLQNHFYSLIRKNKAEKRKSEKQVTSLEGMAEKGLVFPIEYTVTEKTSPLDYIVMNDKMKGFTNKLSPLEKKVFYAHMKNKSIEEIASHLKCEEIKVINALDRCKRKMRKQLEE